MIYKYFFLPSLFLISCSSLAQEKDDFIGKWKVISANNGVSYNYKIDLEIVTQRFKDSLVGKKDSSEIIDKHSSFAKQYTDYYFLFENTGIFKEIDNGDIRLEGTYTINKIEKKIEIKVGKGERERNLAMKYLFMNDDLHVFVKSFFLTQQTELTTEKSTN